MREVQIGILGLGTVGSGVLEIINRRQNEWQIKFGFKPVIKKILVKNLEKRRKLSVRSELFTTDAQEILADPDIQVIIEVMGGEEPALDYVRTSLLKGKHVVTANKLMLAKYGPELFQLAKKVGVEIGFEASVGGGIPIIEPLKESLIGNEIQVLMGIINGTTNYILTAMTQHQESYYDVLEKAQNLGYAETDPSSDVDGWDACYKLSVLTAISFGQQMYVDQIPTSGISQITLKDLDIANELGYSVKLIAKAGRIGDQIFGRVHPTLLPKNHPLAQVDGVNNALWVYGDAVGEVGFFGPGAGMMATGSAVTADLVRICRYSVHQSSDSSTADVEHTEPVLSNSTIPEFLPESLLTEEESCFYIPFSSTHKPNLGKLVSGFDQLRIGILSVYFKDDGDLYNVGILTDIASRSAILEVIQQLQHVQGYREINYYYVERGDI